MTEMRFKMHFFFTKCRLEVGLGDFPDEFDLMFGHDLIF